MREANPAPEAQFADSYLVVHNSAILLFRYLVLWGLSGVLILFVPRYLGDEGLGRLQFALSFVSLFTIGIALGVKHYLIKEIARDHSQIHAYLGAAMGLRLLMALIVLPIIVLAAHFTGLSGPGQWIIGVAAVWLVVTSFAQLLGSVSNGLENMTWPAMAETAGKVAVVAIGIPVLVSGQGVLAYAGVLVVGAGVQLGVNAWCLARKSSLRFDFHPPRIKALLVGGAPFLLMGFVLSVYHHVDVVMLRMFSSEAVVGWYAAAMQIFHSVEFIVIAITTALLPTLARIQLTDTAMLASIARRSIAVVGLFTVPLALGVGIFSHEIIAVLPYPDVFRNSVPLLAILSLSIPITAILTLLGTIAIAADRQNQWALALLGTVIFNVVLNALAIPYFQREYGNGAIGAAAATLVSESLMVIVGLRLMPRGVIDKSIGIVFMKIGVASGASALAGLLMKRLEIGSIALIASSAVIYGVLVLATRAVQTGDLRFLWEVARHKFPSGRRAGVQEGS